MNDTSPAIAQQVAARHQAMTPQERWEAASSLFEIARAIVDSSLSANLAPAARRHAWARRVCGSELPEAALLAFAGHGSPEPR